MISFCFINSDYRFFSLIWRAFFLRVDDRRDVFGRIIDKYSTSMERINCSFCGETVLVSEPSPHVMAMDV